MDWPQIVISESEGGISLMGNSFFEKCASMEWRKKSKNIVKIRFANIFAH